MLSAYYIKRCSLSALTSKQIDVHTRLSVQVFIEYFEREIFLVGVVVVVTVLIFPIFSPLRHNQLNKCPLNIYSRLFIERQCHFSRED